MGLTTGQWSLTVTMEQPWSLYKVASLILKQSMCVGGGGS